MSYCDKGYAVEPCIKEGSYRQYKVQASIKDDYWVEDIERYVMPCFTFIKYDIKKPFISEQSNVEFIVETIWQIEQVFTFEAFENVTITTIF